MRAILIFLMLVGLSAAIGGPAGVVLDSQKISVPSIDLRGIDPTVFNTSEYKNEPLGDPHYFWDRQYITQNDTPDATNLVNWSNEWVESPAKLCEVVGCQKSLISMSKMAARSIEWSGKINRHPRPIPRIRYWSR